MLGLRTYHETSDVVKEDNGSILLVAHTNELCPLRSFVWVDNRSLVCYDADECS